MKCSSLKCTVSFKQSFHLLECCEAVRRLRQSINFCRKSNKAVHPIDLRFESPLNSLKHLHWLKQISEIEDFFNYIASINGSDSITILSESRKTLNSQCYREVPLATGPIRDISFIVPHLGNFQYFNLNNKSELKSARVLLKCWQMDGIWLKLQINFRKCSETHSWTLFRGTWSIKQGTAI